MQLDDAERAHLYDLARTASTPPGLRPRRPPTPRVRPGVQGVLDAITAAPAWVRNGRSDIVATNHLGRALYAPVFDDPARPANTARFAFLNPAGRGFYRDWDEVANQMVAVLRVAAGRDPYDRGLSDLIGELSTRSEQFRVRWAAHEVRFHQSGSKRLHHPVVGDLDLRYEVFDMPADPDLSLVAYTAEPASRTADGLALLASWAATTKQQQQPTAAKNSPINNHDI